MCNIAKGTSDVCSFVALASMIADKEFDSSIVSRGWARVDGCCLCGVDDETDTLCTRCIFIFKLKVKELKEYEDLMFIFDHCSRVKTHMLDNGKVKDHQTCNKQPIVSFNESTQPKLERYIQ